MKTNWLSAALILGAAGSDGAGALASEVPGALAGVKVSHFHFCSPPASSSFQATIIFLALYSFVSLTFLPLQLFPQNTSHHHIPSLRSYLQIRNKLPETVSHYHALSICLISTSSSLTSKTSLSFLPSFISASPLASPLLHSSSSWTTSLILESSFKSLKTRETLDRPGCVSRLFRRFSRPLHP